MGGENMNWVDIIIIVYLALSVLTGFMEGLIRTVLSIIGLIVGIILAAHFYTQLGNIFTFISNKNVANIVAFVIILVAVMIIAAIIGLILRSIVKNIMLGWVDKLGGAVIGLILGVLSISAILAVIVKYDNTGLITNSKFSGFFLNKFPVVLKLLPSSFSDIKNYFK
jgi:membrane protein required for colicin V production